MIDQVGPTAVVTNLKPGHSSYGALVEALDTIEPTTLPKRDFVLETACYVSRRV